MNAPSPETILNDMVEILSQHSLSENWTPADSKRYAQMARDLRSVNVGHGDMAFGIIHCLDKNIPEMRRAFLNAIAHMSDRTEPRMNYARSLRKVGLYSEAIAVAVELECMNKSDEVYALLASLCASMGLESKARNYFSMSGLPQRELEAILQDSGQNGHVRAGIVEHVQESLSKDTAIWESLSKR